MLQKHKAHYVRGLFGYLSLISLFAVLPFIQGCLLWIISNRMFCLSISLSLNATFKIALLKVKLWLHWSLKPPFQHVAQKPISYVAADVLNLKAQRHLACLWGLGRSGLAECSSHQMIIKQQQVLQMLLDKVYFIFSLLSSHKPHEMYGNVSRMFMLQPLVCHMKRKPCPTNSNQSFAGETPAATALIGRWSQNSNMPQSLILWSKNLKYVFKVCWTNHSAFQKTAWKIPFY